MFCIVFSANFEASFNAYKEIPIPKIAKFVNINLQSNKCIKNNDCS